MTTRKDVRMASFANLAEFNTFETKQKTKFSMPFFPRNAETGEIRTDLPPVTEYTKPIGHPESADSRVVCYIDDNADTTGDTIIDENEAKKRGWFVKESLPFGILEASGRAPAQTIGTSFVTVNQFDTPVKSRGVNAAGNTITIQTAGRYEIEYLIEFVGAARRQYISAISINKNTQKQGTRRAQSQGDRPSTMTGSVIANLQVGDVIELQISSLQSGSSFDVNAANLTVNQLEDLEVIREVEPTPARRP
jgi:hypothetical protein